MGPRVTPCRPEGDRGPCFYESCLQRIIKAMSPTLGAIREHGSNASLAKKKALLAACKGAWEAPDAVAN